MPNDEDPDDPDRAAILARRRRFIALALSGLATTTACAHAPSRPEACLSIIPGPRGPDSVPIPDDARQRYTPTPTSPSPRPDEPPPPPDD